MARASGRHNATTAIVLIGVVGGMAGLTYAFEANSIECASNCITGAGAVFS